MFIIGGITETFAYALEEKLVDLYNKQLCNKIRGGHGSKSGLKVSKNTRQKIRVANTGKKHSTATKEKIKQARKNQVIPRGVDSPNYGRKHTASEIAARCKIKLDLNFVAYHIWAYEISGLSMAQYTKSMPFTTGTLADWRVRYSQFRSVENKAGPNKQNKKRKDCPKYSRDFKMTAVKLFLKSGLTQKAFANILDIPRASLNNFIREARDLNHASC